MALILLLFLCFGGIVVYALGKILGRIFPPTLKASEHSDRPLGDHLIDQQTQPPHKRTFNFGDAVLYFLFLLLIWFVGYGFKETIIALGN